MRFDVVDIVIVVFVCDDICVDDLDLFLLMAVMIKL